MIILKNGMEILFSYRSYSGLFLKDWLCSWFCVNEPKYFYFGLTIFGLSVTMQKKVKVKTPNTI